MKKLERNLNRLFEKGMHFLKQIGLSDKLILIYHNDVDGVVSATIFSAALKKMGIKISKILPMGIGEFDKNFSHIMGGFDFAIVLDIATEGKIKSSKNILIIDHHPTKNLSNRRIVHINPRFITPEIYQPVSYLTYRFFENLPAIRDLEWLAVLGTVGDYGFRDCGDLLEKWIDVEKKSGLLKNEFGRAVDMINGAIYFLGFEETLEILMSSKNLSDLTKNKKVVSANEKYGKILRDVERDFWRNAKKIRNFLIYSEISKNYKELGSVLATKLASENPNKLIIVVEKNQKCKIHARCETGRIHLGELLKKCSRGLGRGGGHRESAGASIPKKNMKTFKSNLMGELSRFFK